MSVVTPSKTDDKKSETAPTTTVQPEVLEDTPEAVQKRREKEQAKLVEEKRTDKA